MNRWKAGIGVVVFCGIVGAGWADTPYTAAAFADGNALERPRDTRELVYLTSGLGMNYGPARDLAGRTPSFTNVLVTPEAYRTFMQTGVWPEGTAFFLEVRKGMEQVSITQQGATQGEQLALEAAVKDTKRFPDGGWAYFDFGKDGKDARAQPLARTASCYGCHARHGAVEWTFTQFYPDQFALAQQKGTVRKDYDPKAKVAPAP